MNQKKTLQIKLFQVISFKYLLLFIALMLPKHLECNLPVVLDNESALLYKNNYNQPEIDDCFLRHILFKDSLDKKVQNNPYIPDYYKPIISLYLLPESHPASLLLTKLCKKKRITYNVDTFVASGFQKYTKKQHKLIGVHRKLPQYMIKTYTDTHVCNNRCLVNRVVIARKMENIIQQYKMRYIRVPHKSFYILPLTPKPSEPYVNQHGFLVVAEVLTLTSRDQTSKWFIDKKTWNKEWIKELHIMFSLVGLRDIHCMNMRFSPDRKQLIFFDLEHSTDDLSICKNIFKNNLPKKWARLWRELENQSKY